MITIDQVVVGECEECNYALTAYPLTVEGQEIGCKIVNHKSTVFPVLFQFYALLKDVVDIGVEYSPHWDDDDACYVVASTLKGLVDNYNKVYSDRY